MIVVVGGVKGGTGKTTLATNLVVKAAMENKKVLLVDADDQRSTSDWVEQRSSANIETNWTSIQLTGKSLYQQVEKMKADYDLIFIDVGGRDTTSQRSALCVADKYLLPFKPRSLDIWTIGLVKSMLNELHAVNPNLKSYIVINQGDSRGKDNSDAIDILKESDCPSLECLPIFILSRKAYANAASDGLGVMEMKPRDQKAVLEIEDLYNKLIVECSYGAETKSD